MNLARGRSELDEEPQDGLTVDRAALTRTLDLASATLSAVTLPRRTALLGGLAVLSCTAPRKPVTSIHPRPLATLPTTTLPWLTLRDHFVATVGPSAGQGQPLGPLLVLADATFSPRSRFPLHPHRDMEILSVVQIGRAHV